MAYEWGTNIKPMWPFNGQIHIDASLQIWEWDGATQVWMRKATYELRKVRDQVLLLVNISLGDVLAGHEPTKLKEEWDVVYDKSFVELRNKKGGLIARSAHMNDIELNAWTESLLENDGTKYTDDAALHIFEVFDPSKKQLRWNVWNGLYGSFRGRSAYYGNSSVSRNQPNQERSAGYADNFQSCFFPPAPPLPRPNLEAELFNYFFGFVPAHDGRVCWTSGGRKGVYGIPQNANGTIIDFPSNSNAGRWAYDHGSNSYVQAQWGDWDIFTQGMIGCPNLSHQNPCHIMRPVEARGNVLEFGEPRQTMRGVGALCSRNNGPIESMLAFCIRSNQNPNHTAFLIKPLGISKCGFSVPAEVSISGYSVMAVGSYDGTPFQNRTLNLNSIGAVEEKPGIDGWRIPALPYVVERLRSTTASSRATARGVDSAEWPSTVSLYLRNDNNGVRSEIFPGRIKVQRRTNCAPISLIGIR